MKKNILTYLIITAALSITAFGQDVSVYGRLESDEPVYAGQRFNFFVVIDGDNTPATVDDGPLKPFSPQGPQVRDVSQSSVISINGKTTKKIVKRYLVTYSLAVSEPGEYVIPPLDVNVGSEVYKTSPVRFTVSEPETTNRIALEASLSEKECYAGQPVALEVRWYVWQDIAPRVSDYMFSVPVFGDDDFFIEDLSIGLPSGKQTTLQISGVDVVINQRAVKYKGNDCVEVSFSKVLIPKRSGSFDLGRIALLCKINVSRSRFSFNTEYKSYGAKSDSLKLEVNPLPQENKPEDFYGLIGGYDIKAQAQPTDVKIGDPITLKISVGGSGYLKPVRWPDLSQISELGENFILPSETASPEIVDGRKTFTQTIRAKNADVKRIPPIPLSYFDADRGEYVTTRSEPIELNVSPTKVLTLSDVEGGSGSVGGRKLQAVKGGISANYVGSELLADTAFTPQKELFRFPAVLIWAVPLGIFVLCFVVEVTGRDKDLKQAKKRKRLAAKKAIASLKKLKSGGNEAKILLAAAVKSYFADKFDRSAGSLTGEDCRVIVEENCKDPELAQEIAAILEKCEASEYSPLSVDFDSEWVDRSIAVIERIEKCVQ